MMECLSSRVNCTLVTTLPEEEPRHLKTSWNTIATRPSGRRVLDAAKLGMLADRCKADIIHIVGTNALVFSPVCKLLGSHGAIVRQIFTPYERKDRTVRPLRWFVNNLFVGAYAFTTPWIGRWDRDLGSGMRKFLFRPPIDCELYRPSNGRDHDSANVSSHEHSLLYMGPLWPSRFPAQSVLGALGLLVKKGFDVGLTVLTSARSSVALCEEVLAIGKRLGVDRNMFLERKDLSETERVLAYNAADAIIFPYVGPEPEQLADPPFGILESMACGRVVLSTRVLSVPEVVSDGSTGFLIDSASIDEVHQGLIRALTSPDREDVGARARQRVAADFSYPTIRRSLIEAYESLQAG
jgi:glycosyltransferase involved in cell wall biosynthesis